MFHAAHSAPDPQAGIILRASAAFAAGAPPPGPATPPASAAPENWEVSSTTFPPSSFPPAPLIFPRTQDAMPPTNDLTGPNPAFSPLNRPPISAWPAGYSSEASRLTGPLWALIHDAMPLIHLVTARQMEVSPFQNPCRMFWPALTSQFPAAAKMPRIRPGRVPTQEMTLRTPVMVALITADQMFRHHWAAPPRMFDHQPVTVRRDVPQPLRGTRTRCSTTTRTRYGRCSHHHWAAPPRMFDHQPVTVRAMLREPLRPTRRGCCPTSPRRCGRCSPTTGPRRPRWSHQATGHGAGDVNAATVFARATRRCSGPGRPASRT